MRLSDRERRLVLFLGVSVIVWLIFTFAIPAEEETVAAVAPVSAPQTVEAAQLRLDKARAIAARLPAEEESLKRVEASLAVWEKRLLTADTAAQVSAQLTSILRRLVRSQGDSMNLRATDIGQVIAAEDYAEVVLNVSVECQIEGLLNLLADITAQPELLSWRDLRIASTDAKTKRLSVNFYLMARAPKRLAPKVPAPGAAR